MCHIRREGVLSLPLLDLPPHPRLPRARGREACTRRCGAGVGVFRRVWVGDSKEEEDGPDKIGDADG